MDPINSARARARAMTEKGILERQLREVRNKRVAANANFDATETYISGQIQEVSSAIAEYDAEKGGAV